MKLTIVEKNLLSWTAMHIDFVMCKKLKGNSLESLIKNFRKQKMRIFNGSLIVPKNLKKGTLWDF